MEHVSRSRKKVKLNMRKMLGVHRTLNPGSFVHQFKADTTRNLRSRPWLVVTAFMGFDCLKHSIRAKPIVSVLHESPGANYRIEAVLLVPLTPSSGKYCGYDELRAVHQTGYGSRGTVIATPYLGPWTAPYMNILAEESLVDMEHAAVVLIFREEEKVQPFLSELTKVLWYAPCTHKVINTNRFGADQRLKTVPSEKCLVASGLIRLLAKEPHILTKHHFPRVKQIHFSVTTLSKLEVGRLIVDRLDFDPSYCIDFATEFYRTTDCFPCYLQAMVQSRCQAIVPLILPKSPHTNLRYLVSNPDVRDEMV
ncbi:hypothetical protein CLF_102972 [Clonorchis sinensis]|uniref:Uncharacterized protein n=1 Tax=Clonorchis sinensis TaxID=79923 RepID=G7YN97_CLOSI|nr:hypothetical protein CLF_102972 [Clonorchis sinensis]